MEINGWHVRQMRPEDIGQVAALENQIFSEPWSAQSFLDSLQNKANCYLVAEQKDKVIAYCGFWNVAKEGQICNVAVQEQARGQGVAFDMLKQLIKLGDDMGLEAYTLEVRVSNEPAIRLYHHLGFEDSGIRKGFYSKPQEDALIMWKYNNRTGRI